MALNIYLPTTTHHLVTEATRCGHFRFSGLTDDVQNVRIPDVPVTPISTSRNPCHGFMWCCVVDIPTQAHAWLAKVSFGL